MENSNAETVVIPQEPSIEQQQNVAVNTDTSQAVQDQIKSDVSGDDSKSPLKFSLSDALDKVLGEKEFKKSDDSQVKDASNNSQKQDVLIEAVQTKGKRSKTSGESFQELHAKRKEVEEKYNQVQKTLAEQKAKWEEEKNKYSKENEELKGYRFAVDYQSDPEFVEKYINPIESVKSDISGMLNELVQKTGGNPEMLKSIDLENTEFLKSVANEIKDKVGDVEADLFKDKIKELVKSQRSRESAIADARKNYKTYIEKSKNESITKKADWETKSKKTLESRWSEVDENNKPKYPFLSFKEIPIDANDAQKEQFKTYNEQVQKLRDTMVHYSTLDTPEHRAELSMAAVLAAVFKGNMDRLSTENAQLKEKLSKISNVNSVPRSPNSNRNAVNGNTQFKSLADAMENSLSPR